MSAQSTVIAITAWMQPSFAEGATSTLSTATERPLKHNTFIGSSTVRTTIHDTIDGSSQELYFNA